MWAWFVSTKIGRWIVGVTVTLFALAVALVLAFRKGTQHQADADQARDAQAEVQAAQQAQAIHDAAQQAANAVPAPKAPDPVTRDDLDTTH